MPMIKAPLCEELTEHGLYITIPLYCGELWIHKVISITHYTIGDFSAQTCGICKVFGPQSTVCCIRVSSEWGCSHSEITFSGHFQSSCFTFKAEFTLGFTQAKSHCTQIKTHAAYLLFRCMKSVVLNKAPMLLHFETLVFQKSQGSIGLFSRFTLKYSNAAVILTSVFLLLPLWGSYMATYSASHMLLSLWKEKKKNLGVDCFTLGIASNKCQNGPRHL